MIDRYAHLNGSEAKTRILEDSPCIARYIGTKVYRVNGDIRDIISVGRLIQKSDGPAEIEMIMSTLDRYSGN
jgi:hypothetical protein